jgi:SPP1 gp7 family putative phage head morphogenesis protein
VKAVTTDSKINEGLYEALGVDTKKLKKTISAEITRGIASDMPHSDIAKNIARYAKAPLGRAKTIVRTESHRIQQASKHDAQKAAKAKGANVVSQWNSTLDGDTRPSHRKLDGKIVEVGDFFEMDGKKARYPGDFGDPAEDCNCRCQLLQRARLALDEDELKTLKERAEFFGLDKSDDLEDFKKKYLQAAKEESKYAHDETVINPVIKTAKYRNLYNNLNETVEIQRTACEQARTMLNHRNGTKFEDLTFIDSLTGKYLTRDDYDVENEVIPSRRMRMMVTKSEPHTIIAVHNHPGSALPSLTDINTAYEKQYKYGLIACHDGSLMRYEVTGEFNHIIVNSLLDIAQVSIYNNNMEEFSATLSQLRTENVILEVFK